jgi:phosphoglycerol transferase
MTTSLPNRPAWTWVLFAGSIGICTWLTLRALGTHPAIFADEWYYSKLSRLEPLGESMIPSYLYLWLFRATSACGDQFYDCAHVGNVIFLAASAPFVYLIARQVTGPMLAALLGLLSLLAPLNLFTVFFMPEAMYYFGFCVLSWVALTRTGWHWAAHAAASGIVLGLMSLVKVHGLFLVPALCLFLLYARWAAGGRWIATGLGAIAVALAGLSVAKFGLGYLLAGASALHLFGNFYQGAANSAGHRGLLSLLPAAFINARGHLMALAMLAPLPLALIAMSLFKIPRREQAGPAQRLQLYALLMLGAAAGVTILYTASIAKPGVNIEGLRLHLRYYDFVFPLLWLVAAAALGQAPAPGRATLRWTLALLFGVVLVAAWFKLPSYSFSPIDGPDIAALSPHTLAGRVIVVLELVVLLLWAAGRKQALPLFLFVALPATLAVAGVDNNHVVASIHNEGAAEHAVAAARRLVPPGERGLVTLAGSDISMLMRAQFDLDNVDASLIMLKEGAAVEQYQLPVRNKWLLVLGQHALPGSLTPVAQTSEYSLLHMDMHHRRVGYADMHQPFGSGIVASAEGLSYSETWGRWSDGNQVVLHLSRPLPRHARVILKALAYDINTELPFTLHAGSSSQRFRLGWMMQDVGLAFDTDGNTRELVIDVPRPTAPRLKGQPDDRTLGICIADIEIGERGPDQVANN